MKTETDYIEWLTISRGTAVCSWVAVAICAVIDIRIQHNSHIVGLLGEWIRSMEFCLFPSFNTGWERFANKLNIKPIILLLFVDRAIFSIVLYAITMHIFLYMPLKRDKNPTTL